MRSVSKVSGLTGLAIILASLSYGATITGTVRRSDGSLFRGAFIQAENTKTRISVYVLSGKDGQYRAQNLPGGVYNLQIRAVGYRADSHQGLNLGANQTTSVDFELQAGMVRWSDLSGYQGKQLLPDGKGKQLIEQQCFACHMFQSRMAAVKRDRDGWVQAVSFMRTAMHSRLGDVFSDQDAEAVINYLNTTFGVDSNLPKSPTEIPGYDKTVRPVADNALNIVYVEYDMPGPNRMPFSAVPDKDGYLWIPDFGPANRIGRLDPKTGHIEEFVVPNKGTASVHSAVPAPDGSVWAAEQSSNKLAKLDPNSKQVTEYQDTYAPGKEGLENGGSKHTVRVDPKGRVWGTAVFAPLTVYDPKTGEFTHFKDVISPYGVEIDKNGRAWFAEFREGGEIGFADADTGKVARFAPPTPHGWPRRIEIGRDGMIWVAEYLGGRIDRFDPQTHVFKEYKLPGPDPTPYALGIDDNGYIWYSSDDMDVVGRLDPKTGNVTEYPYVHAENMMKEFFTDKQGHMWYGSPPNNKVGYFYLSNSK